MTIYCVQHVHDTYSLVGIIGDRREAGVVPYLAAQSTMARYKASETTVLYPFRSWP
jgi:hypothetical protein